MLHATNAYVVTPKGPRIHGFKMTNLNDHIVKLYNLNGTKLYIIGNSEEY